MPSKKQKKKKQRRRRLNKKQRDLVATAPAASSSSANILPPPFTDVRFKIGDVILANCGTWIQVKVTECNYVAYDPDKGKYNVAYDFRTPDNRLAYAREDNDTFVRAFSEENILRLDSNPVDSALMKKMFPASKVKFPLVCV